ncbi:PREDICTED: uncharacterized protein LOC107353503 [Acropora digitifera]|uniref:uncharacterized protein LOC107353503 n=1 Tax=Acropora digitifera TaxID=70779 RepID=UPI00077A67D2|nr:PREDICTED: uncharacterized protein LOC107353503 [Acropora digitifera]
MSRGPPHRYNPSSERSFRGYPSRYGEFSGYGFYGGPPYKRQRRLSEDDVGQHPMTYGPSYYDPPYARHQEVGLGEFNDFSSVSVEQDIKIVDRDGKRNDPESHVKKRLGTSQQQSSRGPSSPDVTKLSPSPSPSHSSSHSPSHSPQRKA